jgi:hypothetical protein
VAGDTHINPANGMAVEYQWTPADAQPKAG